MNFGGLGQMMGAAPGGYQQGMQANNQIEQQQLQLVDQHAKQIGMQAYFRALQGMMGPQGGQGPQPPMPGQPSMPQQGQGPQMSPQAMPGPQMQSPQMQAPQQMAMQGGSPMRGADGGIMPPDMQSVPASMPQQPTGATPQSPPGGPMLPGSPSGGQPQQQMTWQGIAQAIKQQNPGVDDLALAHALDKFMPMMTLQAQADWRNVRSQVLESIAGIKAGATVDAAGLRSDATVEAAGKRADATTTAATTRAGATVDAAGIREQGRSADREQRSTQFQQREDRLERGLGLRSDLGYQRLEQQKQALEQRVLQGDRRQGVVELRAVIDAQHKLAMEKIMASNLNSTMKPAERQQFIKDQNEQYRAEIEKLRNLTTQRGNITSEQEIPGSQSVTDVPVKPAPPIAPAVPTQNAAPAGGGQPLPQAFAGDADGTTYEKGGVKWKKQGNQLVPADGS